MKKSLQYKLSDHYDGRHFFNPGLVVKKQFSQVLRMYRGFLQSCRWPDHIENRAKPALAGSLSFEQTHVTYINHASHLIQLKNFNILTDPIFSKRAGPFSLLGPKRVRDPGLALTNLPQIHVVLISHNHYDHMDLAALKKLADLFQPLFMVPLGNHKYLAQQKIARVVELDWWESYQHSRQQNITLVPAQHWSMRKMGDANKALWGGFWIHSGPLKIYFAGDTGYGTLFKQIQEKLGAPDISILPIGSYEPRWFMKEQHMNPAEAVLASLDLKSRINIASHHRTFRLSYESVEDPTCSLKQALKSHGIAENVFLTPENGETIIYPMPTSPELGGQPDRLSGE